MKALWLAALLLAGCAGPAPKVPYYWCEPMVVQESPGFLCVPVAPPKRQEVRL